MPEDQEHLAAREQLLQKVLEECAILLQFKEENIAEGFHICHPSRCGPVCTPVTWLKRWDAAFSTAMSIVCPSTSQVSKSKFVSWSNLCAMISLGTLAAQILPRGWLRSYSVAQVTSDFERNVLNAPIEMTVESNYKRDMTVRLHGTSTKLSDVHFRVYLTTTNACCLPAEALLRFMDAIVTGSNSHIIVV